MGVGSALICGLPSKLRTPFNPCSPREGFLIGGYYVIPDLSRIRCPPAALIGAASESSLISTLTVYLNEELMVLDVPSICSTGCGFSAMEIRLPLTINDVLGAVVKAAAD